MKYNYDESLNIFWTELNAATEHFEYDTDDEECNKLRNDIVKEIITKEVLDEANNCLSRDWCKDDRKIYNAFIYVLAKNNYLDIFDKNAYYSRKPKTTIIDGIRYII